MHRLSILVFCSLLTQAPETLAARVFRCEDSLGNLTFTSHGCPTEHKLQIVNPQNPTPSSGKAIPLATPKPRNSRQNESTATVVGERQDGCGNRVTGSLRRSAIIKKQILAGMTKADVESALGQPQRVDRKNGQIRYHYQDLQGNKSQVSFDQAGCVKGK